jgi:hypothetical protein
MCPNHWKSDTFIVRMKKKKIAVRGGEILLGYATRSIIAIIEQRNEPLVRENGRFARYNRFIRVGCRIDVGIRKEKGTHKGTHFESFISILHYKVDICKRQSEKYICSNTVGHNT